MHVEDYHPTHQNNHSLFEDEWPNARIQLDPPYTPVWKNVVG